MGTLYLAQDTRLNRHVTIKVLKEDSDELRERFAREARTAAGLRHVNIVGIFDVDEFDGQPYIAMEYIPGETLGEMIRRRAPIALARKLQMMEDLCSGLAYAHRAGVIHRDVKPANIMVDSEGTLKVLDFGIARLGGSAMTQAGTLMGTLNYMSPEQVAGQTIDTRSDIFAVGAVFYELLSYKQAFAGSMTDVLTRILHRDPDRLTELVPDLDLDVVKIVGKALQRSVAERYQDLERMRRDISPVRVRVEQFEPESATVIFSSDKTIVIQRGLRDTVVEIKALLDTANAALEANDAEAAQAAYEKASAVDPTNREVASLADRIRSWTAEQKSLGWLVEVERLLEAGALTHAGELLFRVRAETPDLPDTRRLFADLERRQEERAQEQIRQAEIRSLLNRAEQQFADQAFEAALRTVDEALARSPAEPAAQELFARASRAIEDRDKRELDRREAEERHRQAEAARVAEAVKVAEETRRADEAAQAEAARVAEDARRLAAARRAAAEEASLAEVARLAEEQRRAVEESRRQQVTVGFAKVRSSLEQGALPDALAALEGLRRLGADDGDLRSLAADLDEALRLQEREEAETRRRQQAASLVEAAERALTKGDIDRARTEAEALRRLSPESQEVPRIFSRIEEAIERRAIEARDAEHRRQVARLLAEAEPLLKAGDVIGAQARMDAARAIESGNDSVERLAARIRAATDKVQLESLQRQVRAYLEDAKRLLKTGDHAGSLRAANAALALDTANREAQSLIRKAEATRSAVNDRPRKQVEAEAERQRELSGRVRNARELVDAGRHEAARAQVDHVLQLAPGHVEALELRAVIEATLKTLAEEAQERARRGAEERAGQQRLKQKLDEAVLRAARTREDVDAHLKAGQAAIGAAAFDDALNQFAQAQQLEPESPEVLRLIAVARRGQRESEAAQRRAAEAAARQAEALRLEQEARRARAKFDAEATLVRIEVPAVHAQTPAESQARSAVGIQPEAGPKKFRGTAVAATVGLVILLMVVGTVERWRTKRAQPMGSVAQSVQPEQALPAPTSTPKPPALKPPEARPSETPPNADPTTPIRQRLRDQLLRGDREQALVAVTEGLKLKPNDPEFLQRLDEMTRNAETAAGRARDDAVASGAPDLASVDYQQAISRLTEAARLRRSQKSDAVHAYGDATDLFGKARIRAASARVIPPAPDRSPAPLPTPTPSIQATAPPPVNVEKLPAPTSAAQRPPETAPAPPQSRPAVDTQEADRQAIGQVLNQYVAAYTALDAAAVARLVATQSVAELKRTFDLYRSYRLALSGTRINVEGDTATVTCVRQIDVVTSRGNQTLHQASATTFKLRRSAGSWVIDSMTQK